MVAEIFQPGCQLGLWAVPDVRSDKDRGMALLFAGICILDSLEGCFARNGWFKRLIARDDDSTVRRQLRGLAECGLIEIEIRRGRDRYIRPLVPIGDVLRSGLWKALALAVLDLRRAPAELKRLAKMSLRGLGRRFCDLKKLAVEPIPRPKKREKCTSSARQNARVYPTMSDSEEKRASAKHVVAGLPGIQEAQPTEGDPAAASLFERLGGLLRPEARSLARWAREAGATLQQVQMSCTALASRKPGSIHSRSGYLRRLVEAAMRGEEVGLSVAPPTHPSDLGERPQRVVQAPPKPRREIPSDWLPGIEHEAARELCNEAASALRAMGTPRPSDSEIRDAARALWQRQNPQEVLPWMRKN